MGKEAATLRGPRGGVIAANSLSLERERERRASRKTECGKEFGVGVATRGNEQ